MLLQQAERDGTLAWLSYLGGSGADTATAAALDSSANLYIAGWTLSANFPVLNGYQSTNAGNYGAFVAKVLSGGGGGAAPTVGRGHTQFGKRDCRRRSAFSFPTPAAQPT